MDLKSRENTKSSGIPFKGSVRFGTLCKQKLRNLIEHYRNDGFKVRVEGQEHFKALLHYSRDNTRCKLQLTNNRAVMNNPRL